MYHRSPKHPKGYLHSATRNSGRMLQLPPRSHRPPTMRWRHDITGQSLTYGFDAVGPTAIFLHGWAPPRSYRCALSRLAHNGVSVYAPRLPIRSAGKSAGSVNLTLNAYVSGLDNFLDAMGIDTPITLVGHSLGGAIAIKTAYDRPDRVAQLILVNPLGGETARRPPPHGYRPSAVVAKAMELTRELEYLAAQQLPVSLLWGRDDRIVPRSSDLPLRDLADPRYSRWQAPTTGASMTRTVSATR